MPKKLVPGSRMIEVMPAMKIKYKDIFDIKEFYLAMKEWCMDHGWRDEEDGSEHMESYYGERINNGVREIFFRWRLFKPAEGSAKAKVGHKLNLYLDLDFHAIGLVDTEVIKEGAKIKVQKGEINIDIMAMIDKVYEQEFAESELLKKLKNIFTARIYQGILDQRRKELYQEMYVLNNYIKQWFKLRRYLPHEETGEFFRSYAWPSHLKE